MGRGRLREREMEIVWEWRQRDKGMYRRIQDRYISAQWCTVHHQAMQTEFAAWLQISRIFFCSPRIAYITAERFATLVNARHRQKTITWTQLPRLLLKKQPFILFSWGRRKYIEFKTTSKLKVHKRENFLGSDFAYSTFSQLLMHKQ